MHLSADAQVYDLEQPRYFGAPVHPGHAPGYMYTLHRHHEGPSSETRTSASGYLYMTEHVGTHIDALCHQAEELHLYGGVPIDPRIQTGAGFSQLGAETIPPLVMRGILLDIARLRGVERIAAGDQIRREELEEAAERQGGLAIQTGDVVLLNTGNSTLWHDPQAYLQAGGVSAGASAWLAERGVKAVGADNMAWDEMGYIDPELNVSLPGHLLLLVRAGIYIIENLNLQELARDQRYEFTFVCLPLKFSGATGSPVRPIAIVS